MKENNNIQSRLRAKPKYLEDLGSFILTGIKVENTVLVLAATSVRYLFIQCLAVAWEGTRGMSLLMMGCSLLDVRVFKDSSLCNCFVVWSNILSALKTAHALYFSAPARAGF